ncbi:protein AaeX [Ferrovum sp. JA12]|uniref:DUF1656 domain-containing protein n=1 Tax=Ferrovum sp. JA12 TaxID=1356299 RepID=UPI000702A331|nr:DUF1656 domain-containing protein [Ferrovum sp. JA12]KRH79741.1 protein AaeX [Ferrovum sp. JA12]HQT80651.1 DUF1656 domain-containing protein [Ferrovaceae bacterium]HQU05861.1 DUF1656 domain-containing protein [Ferrovaceae bacterium]
MMKLEIVFMGAELPTLVLIFVITGIIMLYLDKQFVRTRLYQMIWHPALFRTALFAVIFSLLALLIY